MSLLFPEGIDCLPELPHTLLDAIVTGLMYLGFEELPEEEQPPRGIWQHPKQLKEWFAEVKRKRKQKYGGGEDDIRDVPIEGPVSQNAAVDELFGGAVK